MKRILALILCLGLLVGCGSAKPEKVSRTVFAMDTVMTLTAYGTEKVADAALTAAEKEINRLDALLSVSSEAGDIRQVSRESTAKVSEEMVLLLRKALFLSAETDGAFDPTVYPLMELWGFTAQEYRVPTEEEISQTLALVDYQQVELLEDGTVTIPDGSGLDLGGIAKGFTGDRVMEVLREKGITSAVVSLGGNIACLGKKPDGSLWTVGVQDPKGSGTVASLSLGVPDRTISAVTSGAYERYFEEDGLIYHHILDPRTGYPADSDLLSVTVVCEDGTMADALSTTLFVLGKDKAVEYWRSHTEEFQMVLITEEGLTATPGLEISTEQPLTILEE